MSDWARTAFTVPVVGHGHTSEQTVAFLYMYCAIAAHVVWRTEAWNDHELIFLNSIRECIRLARINNIWLIKSHRWMKMIYLLLIKSSPGVMWRSYQWVGTLGALLCVLNRYRFDWCVFLLSIFSMAFHLFYCNPSPHLQQFLFYAGVTSWSSKRKPQKLLIKKCIIPRVSMTG